MKNLWHMADSRLFAYVDETGTNELDSNKSGVSNLFICVAVLVDEEGRATTEAGMEELSRSLWGGAEIKSQRIGTNHERRMNNLDRIQALPFSYYALVINKDRVPKDSGLRFKRSFYKFINRMLYSKLAAGGRHLHVVADGIGGQEFMDSFKAYLEGKGLPDLFSQFEHEFTSSSENRMLQLADLIAGTLSYCYDEQKRSVHSSGYRQLLRGKEIGIQCWPLDYDQRSQKPASVDESMDDVLRPLLKTRVYDFIDQHEDSADDDRRMQTSTLKRLLFARIYEEGADQSVYADSLIAWLEEEGFEKLSKQPFTNRVIGKLRDAGIILAGRNDGYRLALSSSDIDDYIRHDKSIIEPMLHRLLIARDTVKSGTANRYDILATGEHHNIRSIADQFRDSNMEVEAMRTSDV